MQTNELLISQIRTSLMRLAGQLAIQNKDAVLNLNVSEIARPVCNVKKPINHDHCNPFTDEVRIDNVDYIYVEQSVRLGMCIRLAFAGQLYVAKGDQASVIDDWVKTVSGISIKEKQIPPFPEVNFCKVAGTVKVDNGELVLA